MADIDIETAIDAELRADLEISKHYVTACGWKYYEPSSDWLWETFAEDKKLSETELKAVNCLLKGFSNKEIKKRIKNLEGAELEKKAESFRKTVERVKRYLKFVFVYKQPLATPCTALIENPKKTLDNADVIEHLKSKQYGFLAGLQETPALNKPLFGREQLIESLAEKVLIDKKSLLLLQGALGIGKKSLARAIALKIQATDHYRFHSIDFDGFVPSAGDAAYRHFIQKLLYITSPPLDRATIPIDETVDDALFVKEKSLILDRLTSEPRIIVLDDFEKFSHDTSDPFCIFFSELLNAYTGSVFIINSVASPSFTRELMRKLSKMMLQKKIGGISFDASTEMLLSEGVKNERSLHRIIDAYSGHPGELRVIAKVIKEIFEASPDLFVKDVLDGGSVFLSELYGYRKILDRCPPGALKLIQSLVKSGKSTFTIRDLIREFGASANTEINILLDLSLIDEVKNEEDIDTSKTYRINRVVQRSLEKYFNQG